MSSRRLPSLSRGLRWLAALLLVAGLAWLQRPGADVPATPPAAGDVRPSAPAHEGPALPDFLPPEAGPVVERILRGGPFPYRQDGAVFGNREGRLPPRPRGHYREYTVPTPGLSHRGARRIVTGGDPPTEWYYTADHYETFRPFRVTATETHR